MENLNKNLTLVGINCNNAVNSFEQISLTKFVEVDIEELPKDTNKPIEDKQVFISKEEKDQKLLNSLKNSICISLNKLNLKNTNAVKKNKIKLPFIIGTEEFFNNEDLGIKDDIEEIPKESKVLEEVKNEEEPKIIEPVQKVEKKTLEIKEKIIPQIGGIFPNKKPTLFEGVLFSDEEDTLPEKKNTSIKKESTKEQQTIEKEQQSKNNNNNEVDKMKIQLDKFIQKGLFDIEDDEEEYIKKNKVEELKSKDSKKEIKSESNETKKGLQKKNKEKSDNIFDNKLPIKKENSLFKESKKKIPNKQEKAERLLFRMFEEDDEDEEKNKNENKNIEDIQTKTQDFALKISNILNEVNAGKPKEKTEGTFKKPLFLDDDSDQENYQMTTSIKKDRNEPSLITKEQKNTQNNINKLKDILGERFASASGSGESPFILPQKKKEISIPEMNLSSPRNPQTNGEKELTFPILKKKKPKKPKQFLFQHKTEDKNNPKKVDKGKSKDKKNKNQSKEEKKNTLFIFEEEEKDKNILIKSTQTKSKINNEEKKPKKITFDYTFDDD